MEKDYIVTKNSKYGDPSDAAHDLDEQVTALRAELDRIRFEHEAAHQEAADLRDELEAVKQELDLERRLSFRNQVVELEQQRDELQQQRDELVARLIASREALQMFRRRLYLVPSFGSNANRATREALTLAQSVILNLDTVGGPLDYPQINGRSCDTTLAKVGKGE